MWWLIIAFAAIGVAVAVQGYLTVRRNVRKFRHGHESRDEMMVERLRARGYTAFNEYRVDFFLALPDETACQRVRARLEPEGFSVDVKPIRGETDLPLSVFNELRVASIPSRRRKSGAHARRASPQPEGIAAQTPAGERVGLPFSLHASRHMRLNLADIQAVSRRMSELAGEFHGGYDGWVA